MSKDDIAAIERAIDALEAQMDKLGDIDAINRRLDELEQKADNYATDKELSDAIDAIYDKLDELIKNGGNTGEDWSDDIAAIYETLDDIIELENCSVLKSSIQNFFFDNCIYIYLFSRAHNFWQNFSYYFYIHDTPS